MFDVIGLILSFMLGGTVSYFLFRNKHKSVLEEHKDIVLRIAENSPDILYHFQFKPEPKFKYMNPAVDRIMGDDRRETSYKNAYACFDNVHPDDYQVLMDKVTGNLDYSTPILQRWSDRNGNYRWFEDFAMPVYKQGELVGVEGIIRDITDKVNLERDLEYRVTHDILTNLFNREHFEQTWEKYDKHMDSSVAIVLCDLDELKQMNDIHGHKMGDVLIKETAKLLGKFSSEKTLVCRIGGDEFAILLTDTSEMAVRLLVDKLSEEISEYNMVRTEITIRMSIGYAFRQWSKGNLQEVFNEADNRMYYDKESRKSLHLSTS